MDQAGARTAVFKPVAPPSTYEETVARLGTAIRIGVLAPGTRLPPERELAEQLGISRSTLRQALGTLTQTGHLIAVRGRAGGTFVADEPPMAIDSGFDIDTWRELMDWRSVLEVGGVYLAAERIDAAQLERLEEAVETCEAAAEADWPAFRRADAQFHLIVSEAACNPRLIDAMTQMQGEVGELFGRLKHPSTVLRHASGQHRRILACLREGNAAGAADAMRDHLDGTERLVEVLLA